MREPRAIPTTRSSEPDVPARHPRAFEAASAEAAPDPFRDSAEDLEDASIAPAPRRKSRFWRNLAIWCAGTLISLGIALAIERLIRDLFATYDWLGWAGLVLAALFAIAMLALIAREIAGLMRLRTIDHLRHEAMSALEADDLGKAQSVARKLLALYAPRADLARARATLETDIDAMLDGAELIRTAERDLMGSLDTRARALTAASARRVALVTAVSPRALIEMAFIVFESFRLARNLADLYGARPGFFGFLRVIGAILTHLAVTGGMVLTDGVVEQLVGQGVAARLSARLGEGLVNGLMTVRVGIAAMRVVRPMPYAARKSPVVSDFVADLAKVATTTQDKGGAR